MRTSTLVASDATGYLAYQIVYPPATGVTITPSSPTPHTQGAAVIFTATGIGSAGYQYQFWFYDGTAWSMVQDYGVGSSWTMPSTTPAGDYVIAVNVRTSALVASDKTTYLAYQVVWPPATGVTITPSAPSPHLAGTAVTFTASGTGSTGTYQYQFWLYNGTTWTMVQGYGVGASWIMPSTTPVGNYVIGVNVRTSNLLAWDVVNYLSYTIQ